MNGWMVATSLVWSGLNWFGFLATLLFLTVHWNTQPLAVSEPLNAIHAVKMFLVFLAWLAAVWGWGSMVFRCVVGSRLGLLTGSLQTALSFGFGSLIFSLIAGLLGGFKGLPGTEVFLAVVVAGLYFATVSLKAALVGREICDVRRSRPSVASVLMVLTVIVWIVSKVSDATIPGRQGDPLYYHLVSARFWVNQSAIKFRPQIPLIFQSSYWEYLYLWPASFFAGGPLRGLLEIQIFSQWIHVILGAGGSGLSLYSILRFLNFSRWTSLLSVLSALGASSLWWSQALAKNDWGVIFWSFLGLAMILRFPDFRKRESAIAGGFLGAAFVGKFTTIFFIFGVLAIIPFLWAIEQQREKMTGTSIWSLATSFFIAFASLILPIWVRNSLATGNPFFPVPVLGFSSDEVSLSFLEILRDYSGQGIVTNLGAFWGRFQILIREGIFVFSIIVILLLGIKIEFRQSRFWISTIVPGVISFFLFNLISGPKAELRLLGPSVILMVGLSTAFFINIANSLEILRGHKIGLRFKNIWSGLCAVLIFATCRLPMHRIPQLFTGFPLNQHLESQTAFDSKAWILKNVPVSEKIMTGGENEHYYLSDYAIASLVDDPLTDRMTRPLKTGQEILEVVKSLGYRYFLYSTLHGGNQLSGAPQIMTRDIESLKEKIVFRGRQSMVFDLKPDAATGETNHEF